MRKRRVLWSERVYIQGRRSRLGAYERGRKRVNFKQEGANSWTGRAAEEKDGAKKGKSQ